MILCKLLVQNFCKYIIINLVDRRFYYEYNVVRSLAVKEAEDIVNDEADKIIKTNKSMA